VSRTPSPPARALDELLRELGPRLRRGALPDEERARWPTGIPELDRLLGGGFPRGRLAEIAGAASSGRTSLALRLLAETTRTGAVCAVVDAADGLDPRAAEAAGVDLERVLWARCPSPRAALSAAQHVLETQGFGLVLLDLAVPPAKRGESHAVIAPPVWKRMARVVAGTRAALVLLAGERTAGTAAEVALEMRAARARFGGSPALLEALETDAFLVRHRGAPAGHSARLRLCAAESD
jgi:RecA/RadA recombinase